MQFFSSIFKSLFSKKEMKEEEKEEEKRKEEIIKNQAKELRDRCIKIKDNDKEISGEKPFLSSKLTKEDIDKWCEILLKEGKEEILLGKNGKRLNGIALTNRVAKYLKMEKRDVA